MKASTILCWGNLMHCTGMFLGPSSSKHVFFYLWPTIMIFSFPCGSVLTRFVSLYTGVVEKLVSTSCSSVSIFSSLIVSFAGVNLWNCLWPLTTHQCSVSRAEVRSWQPLKIFWCPKTTFCKPLDISFISGVLRLPYAKPMIYHLFQNLFYYCPQIWG